MGVLVAFTSSMDDDDCDDSKEVEDGRETVNDPVRAELDVDGVMTARARGVLNKCTPFSKPCSRRLELLVGCVEITSGGGGED